MSIYSCTFVKPTFVLGCVNAYYKDIIFMEIDIVRNIIIISHISTLIISYEKTIKPYLGIAENPIELNGETFSGVRFFNRKRFTVPTHAILGIQSTNRFVS